MPVICQTELLLLMVEKNKLSQLKMYLPTTLDNIQTLHRSAVPLAMCHGDFVHTTYVGYSLYVYIHI